MWGIESPFLLQKVVTVRQKGRTVTAQHATEHYQMNNGQQNMVTVNLTNRLGHNPVAVTNSLGRNPVAAETR